VVFAGVGLLALLASPAGEVHVADVPELGAVVGLAVLRLGGAASWRVVFSADVVLYSGGLSRGLRLFLRHSGEEAGPFRLPRGPDVGEVVCCEERLAVEPVEGVSPQHVVYELS